MSNPYLEKAASLYDFWNDLTGKEHADLKARKHHLERALANGDTVEGLAAKVKTTGARTFRARAGAAGALGATAALGLYGAKKYTDHQNDKARENLYAALEMHKQASIVNLLKPVASSFGDVAKTGAKSFLDLANTAHGGKVGEFAYQKFGGNTPNFKKFMGKKRKVQERYVKMKHGPDALKELKGLRTKQRVAQIGLYGTAATVATAYSKGKTKGYNQAYGY